MFRNVICGALFVVALASTGEIVKLQAADGDGRDLSEVAQRIHRESILVDAHNDITGAMTDAGYDLAENSTGVFHTDFQRLQRGGVTALFFSIYIDPALYATNGATARALKMIDSVHQTASRHPDKLRIGASVADIQRAKREGYTAALLGGEGGYAIENSLEVLRMLHRLGVRYMTLTHNQPTAWAGANTNGPGTGLTDFGRQVVREMNRLGMLVDVSHVSDRTMSDVLDISAAPVIASHSSARALCEVPRNIPDGLLRRIATNGGVVMVNFYSGFLDPAYHAAFDKISAESDALWARYGRDLRGGRVAEQELVAPLPVVPIGRLIEHIDHIVRVAGIDHVGIGSDFDGVERTPEGLADVSCFPRLTEELLRRGYRESDVRKILGGNFLRVLGAAERIAHGGASESELDPAEITIAEFHRRYRAGTLTAAQLVRAYLKRIEAYDQPARLNSLVTINPDAIDEAGRLDAEFRRSGLLRPLHGVPMIVKDNFGTTNLPTSAGSLALKHFVPAEEAFQLRKLREAGAIVLAKANMDEWALHPGVTVSSVSGITRNPYDFNRVPAGSSGGTAAAVAANFGLIGLGTDTGNSIRGPASHNSLVGLRTSMGLASRAGIIPLFFRNDIAGPITRTVEDAARVLNIIAGYDPADPVTELARTKRVPDYLAFLSPDGLKGARLGVFRRYIETPKADREIRELFSRALRDLGALGATIVDPVDLSSYEELTQNLWCEEFRSDLERYLAAQGTNAPYTNFSAIIDSGLYLPANADALRFFSTNSVQPCGDVYNEPRNIALRNAILAMMDEFRLDAIIYPTWSNPPLKVGDTTSAAGDNSQILSPHTGMPAITVPMGFTHGECPAGISFVTRPFRESELLKFAYAYETATRHRHPPQRFP